MKSIFWAIACCLCLALLGATAAQARTITLKYDITTTFVDEFARSLYYQDPDDPDPFSDPIPCNHGEDCYPEDWRPGLFAYEIGDTLHTTLDIVLFEGPNGYSVTSYAYGGDLNLSMREAIPVFGFDKASGDISFSIFDFSFGWAINLEDGSGLIEFAREYGSVTGIPTGCYTGLSRLSLPDPFCDAYDAEAHFAVDSYTVTSEILQVPLPASALFLLSAIGGLVLRGRLKARA